MRRPALLVLVGFCLLTAAVVVPIADLFTADWDRDFTYRTTDEGWCAEAVSEFRETGTTDRDGFVVDAASLSETARANVRRAVRDGEYTVETGAEVGGDTFSFPSDHVDLGHGCYAVRGVPETERDVVALETASVSHRTDTLQQTAAIVGSRVAFGGGVLSLIAGVGLALRQRVN